MQNKTPKIRFKTERDRFECLIISGLGRDKNIAQIAVIAGEREHVCRLIETAILPVVTTHRRVGNEHDGERTLVNLEVRYQVG